MIRVNAELFRQAHRCVEDAKGSRHQIQGVHIERHAVSGVVLVATDGHRAIVIHDEFGEISEPSALVQLGKVGLRLCKGEGAERRVLVLPGSDPHSAHVEVRIVRQRHWDRPADVLNETVPVPDATLLDSQFPDWRRMLPRETFTNPGQPAYDATLLAEFASIAKELYDIEYRHRQRVSVKKGTLSLEWADPHGPALVHLLPCRHAFGILMPQRSDGFDGYPSFLDARPALRNRPRTAKAASGATPGPAADNDASTANSQAA